MNSVDVFLVQYGLAAIFLIMFIKSIGVPIPIPGDLIILTAAARVAQGKLVLWQAFVAIFIALVYRGTDPICTGTWAWTWTALPFWSLCRVDSSSS